MVRAARSTQVHVAVVGWRQTTGGRLWTVGELVRVADPALGVDADFVVESVSFALDESGSITELELQPPEGFGVLSEPRKATGTTRKVGAWAELEGGV
jgi:prophage tail gpP-like protein